MCSRTLSNAGRFFLPHEHLAALDFGRVPAGLFMEKVALGQIFLRVPTLVFPLLVSLHQFPVLRHTEPYSIKAIHLSSIYPPSKAHKDSSTSSRLPTRSPTIDVCVCMYVSMYVCMYVCMSAQVVEALRYKPEGRGFDSRWNH
jgi:hypothetical protein